MLLKGPWQSQSCSPLKASSPLFHRLPSFPFYMQVWLRIVRLRLEQGDAEAASATLARSLQSLPKSEHVHMISHSALLEFKHGDAGRRAAPFAGLVEGWAM